MKEKWIQINTIEGYENVKDQYWISSSDEDIIVNKNMGRIKQISINNYELNSDNSKEVVGNTTLIILVFLPYRKLFVIFLRHLM